MLLDSDEDSEYESSGYNSAYFASALQIRGQPVDRQGRVKMKALLRIPDGRRQQYFGHTHRQQGEVDGLNGWFKECASIRHRRGACLQNILSELELIRRRIELRPLFRDWYYYALLLQKHRLNIQERKFKQWKRLYYAIKYRILDRLCDKMLLPRVRTLFRRWADEVMWLRAIAIDVRECKRRHFDDWKKHIAAFRLGRLLSCFRTWSEWTRREVLDRKLTNEIVLMRLRKYWEQWRLRRLEEHVMRVLRLRLLQKYFQLMLPTLQAPSPIARSPTRTPKPVEPDYNCACIAKIVKGGHCDCRKDVHFRRRLAYCFQEVETFLDDRDRIRQSLSRTSTPFPGASSATRARGIGREGGGAVRSARKQMLGINLNATGPAPRPSTSVTSEQNDSLTINTAPMSTPRRRAFATASATTTVVPASSRREQPNKRLFESPAPTAPPSRTASPVPSASPKRRSASPSSTRPSPTRSASNASPGRASLNMTSSLLLTPRQSLDRLHFNESVEHGTRVSMTHWNTGAVQAGPPSLEPYHNLEV